MQSNKLRMAIRATAAMTVLSLASQANAFTVNAGDVEAKIYGYAQLTATYDMNEDISGPALEGSFGDLGGTDEDIEGHFAGTANQSRLGVSLTHPQGVKATIEGDFYQGDFRLRHAFGEYKGFLAGQTWSNYNSFVGTPSLLDFNGAAGTAGRQLRNAQVRYTTGTLSFSAEEPSDAGVIGGSQKTGTPTFTVRMEDAQGGLSYSVAAMAKQVSSDDGTDDDSAIGYGAFGAVKMKVSDMITLQGTINYVDGGGSYLYQSGMSDAYMDGDSIETIAGYGGSVGVGVGLGGGRSLNLGLGMTEVDWDDAESDGIAVGGEDETRQNLFLNYQWSPVKNVMMGIEYGYWKAETVDGDSADANRVMYVSRYSF
ncbi:hypothetical protein KUV78_00705 [Marinobacter hydrocarbonoclasticus]|uniref:DcaP family trimeric outer membrane transporter n=1 Tax=Marinobacter nauticus TaxID=2743 RepID=UPI001C977D4D|nr:DcaP family trimeric outer membrane transporter [Marinobacter nauticus]MBY6192301.1 hypothetical protein [Marinobacter nauticus]MBY6213449.1 hypothetical protein [Marinobacter nauticus]